LRFLQGDRFKDLTKEIETRSTIEYVSRPTGMRRQCVACVGAETSAQVSTVCSIRKYGVVWVIAGFGPESILTGSLTNFFDA
jgi:hypothetical protein